MYCPALVPGQQEGRGHRESQPPPPQADLEHFEFFPLQCDAIRWEQFLEMLSWTAFTWLKG